LFSSLRFFGYLRKLLFTLLTEKGQETDLLRLASSGSIFSDVPRAAAAAVEFLSCVIYAALVRTLGYVSHAFVGRSKCIDWKSLMLDAAHHGFREMKLQEPLRAIVVIAMPTKWRFHRADAA
jgi:hypothetical protein